jgi:tRNA threonylcarbamoyladenosine biosynthesis protein TsaB
MKLLLIETSSKIIEFGYAEDNELILDIRLGEEENADTLVYFIKKEFDKRRIEINEINVVSLSNGPGSFTGLRIGSAIAKGICIVNHSKLIQVPTLDVIANKYRILNNIKNSEKKITSLVFSNMKTKEFYLSDYKISEGKITRTSDYQIKSLNDLDTENRIFIVDDNIPDDVKYQFEILVLKDKSNIPSLFNLTNTMIEQERFSDYLTSEPFYLKEFIPLRKKNSQ